MGAAGIAVIGLLNLDDAVLDKQLLVDAVVLVFLATLFSLSGWSAGRYASAVKAGRFVCEQQKVRAAHQGLYLFLGFIALAVLTVVGLAWSWVAAGFGASVLLVAWLNILAGGVPVEDGSGSWSGDWFDDEDISNRDGIKSTYTDPSYSYMPENIYYTGD